MSEHILLLVCALLGLPLTEAFQPQLPKTHSHHLHRRSYRLGALKSSNSNMPQFCERCGTATRIEIPSGDERERSICGDPECGHVTYQNPKVVCGVVATHQEKVLLCQRNIEPCKGKWGYPQGFLELGESSRQGAAREAYEEAGITLNPDNAQLLALFNLGGMQVQVVYRVELDDNTCEAGHESSDVKFVSWDEVWDYDLAFPTVEWALKHADEMRNEAKPAVLERTKVLQPNGEWTVEEG